MSDVRSTAPGSVYGHAPEDWRGRAAPARQTESGGLSPGWVVAGVAAVALGAWMWYHFGADLKRYIKMERM